MPDVTQVFGGENFMHAYMHPHMRNVQTNKQTHTHTYKFENMKDKYILAYII